MYVRSTRSASSLGCEVARLMPAGRLRGPVWVIEPDGSQRAADFVGEGELSAWFGGSATVIVVYPDSRTGEAVEVDRVIPRDA
jgi:hypothetical protein